MNFDIAELHVRSIVRDVLNEQASDRVLENEEWLDVEVRKVISAVSASQGENVNDMDAQARGLDRYADTLREQLAEQFPGDLGQS